MTDLEIAEGLTRTALALIAGRELGCWPEFEKFVEALALSDARLLLTTMYVGRHNGESSFEGELAAVRNAFISTHWIYVQMDGKWGCLERYLRNGHAILQRRMATTDAD